MAKNSVGRVVGDFYVGVYTKDNPTSAEWSEMLSLLVPGKMKGSLIYTDGGAPSAIQRKQARDFLIENNLTHMRSAVLTQSVVARIAITALNLFIKDLSAPFPPEDIDQALQFMQVPTQLWPEMKKALKELQQELGIYKEVKAARS